MVLTLHYHVSISLLTKLPKFPLMTVCVTLHLAPATQLIPPANWNNTHATAKSAVDKYYHYCRWFLKNIDTQSTVKLIKNKSRVTVKIKFVSKVHYDFLHRRKMLKNIHTYIFKKKKFMNTWAAGSEEIFSMRCCENPSFWFSSVSSKPFSVWKSGEGGLTKEFFEMAFLKKIPNCRWKFANSLFNTNTYHTKKLWAGTFFDKVVKLEDITWSLDFTKS